MANPIQTMVGIIKVHTRKRLFIQSSMFIVHFPTMLPHVHVTCCHVKLIYMVKLFYMHNNKYCHHFILHTLFVLLSHSYNNMIICIIHQSAVLCMLPGKWSNVLYSDVTCRMLSTKMKEEYGSLQHQLV